MQETFQMKYTNFKRLEFIFDLQVNTLLGSSVSDPFTGQSIRSAELKSDGALGSVTSAIVHYICFLNTPASD